MILVWALRVRVDIQTYYTAKHIYSRISAPINNAFASQNAKVNVREKIFIYIQD